MQAAGEEEQRQRPVEEEVRQIGGGEGAAKPAHDVQMQNMVATDDDGRQGERAEQHADCRRQPDPEIVDAADRRGNPSRIASRSAGASASPIAAAYPVSTWRKGAA